MAATTATFRYGHPDVSVGPEKRALYMPPPFASVSHVDCSLIDFDSSSGVARGAQGLDVQGFTFLKHTSAVQATDEEDFTDSLLEEVYYPEIEDLIRECTGAKQVKIVFSVFRFVHANFDADITRYIARDSERGRLLESAPVMSIPVLRKGGGPVPLVHADYTSEGLRDAIRFSRRDIRDAAHEAIAAEDAGLPAPRYTAYSVWRPLKPVKKDPIAVCDWRSIDPSDLEQIEIRVPGEIKTEYLLKGYFVKPPANPAKHKWYWRPNMTPEDVLIIKLGDNLAASNTAIAQMSPHSAAKLHGADSDEPRFSLDCRVMAFW